jgi:hypothetical protein
MNMEVIQVKQFSFKDFATRNFTFPTLGHTQFTAVRFVSHVVKIALVRHFQRSWMHNQNQFAKQYSS